MSIQNIELCDDLPEHFKCAICSRLLDNPIQTFDGLSACMKCYQKYTRCDDAKDSQKPKFYFEDHTKANAIGNLLCYCKNREVSCNWIGKVKFLKDHEGNCKIPTENVCEFSTLITSINLNASQNPNWHMREERKEDKKLKR